MKHAVVTENLTKRYRHTNAIDGLNLELPKGEIIALLGANGAGKSTLLKMLVNLVKPSKGSATILGVVSKRLTHDHFSKIGFVAEDQQLPKKLTVNQYLASCRPFYQAWDRDLENRLLSELDLDGSGKIEHLSRGQRMKAQLVSCLSFRPEMIILDEPLGGLDPLMRKELLAGLLEVSVGDEPPTVIISSHDVDEIEHVASWVTFISKGRELLSARAGEIESNYRLVTIKSDAQAELKGLPISILGIQTHSDSTTFIDTNFKRENYQFPVDDEALSLKSLFHTLARSERHKQTN